MLISHRQVFLVFLLGILVGFLLSSIFMPFNELNSSAASSLKCQCHGKAVMEVDESEAKNGGIWPNVGKIMAITRPPSQGSQQKAVLARPMGKTVQQKLAKERGGAGPGAAGGATFDWHDPKGMPAEMGKKLGVQDDMAGLGEMFFHGVKNAHNETETLAAELGRRIRIFCWIMTGAENHESKAVHVKATWAKRCNKYVFISSKESAELPAISLNITEGRDHLWGKTKAAFKFAYEKYLNDFDWFLKVDDDTFVIVENLRFMLMAYSPEEPIHHGCKFSPIVKQGYMSGGAGYVLSRAALRLFVEKGIPDPAICRQDENGAEDAEMGKCMERLGIRAGDSRDNEGHHRFFPFSPDHHLPPGQKDPDYWFWRNIYYDMDQGPGCCSDYAISFHYMTPAWLYVMEYMVYHLRPYGLDMPFEADMDPSVGDGQGQFQLLGQMVVDDAQKQADQMMGRDDVAWKRGGPTMGPQIITKAPPMLTTTTTAMAMAIAMAQSGNGTKRT